MPKRSGEDGFALIGAVWLLMLGAAIVALLMLRAHSEAAAAKSAATDLTERAAATAAVHTIAAELLLLGPRSRWATTPAQGALEVDGTTVRVELTSEEGRVDLNAVSLDRLDAVLQQLGLQADARRRIADAVATRRESGQPFASFAEIAAILSTGGGGRCLLDAFTFVSGLAEPRADQLVPLLASAVPQAAERGAFGRAPQSLGTPERFVVTAGSGLTLTALVRVTPSPSQPLLVMSWSWRRLC